MASGINNTFRQVGIATGIAGLGAIFQHQVTSKHHRARWSPAAPGREVRGAAHGQLASALVSGDVAQLARHLPPAARAALGHAYRVGFTDAFTTILIIAACDRAGRLRCARSCSCAAATSSPQARRAGAAPRAHAEAAAV